MDKIKILITGGNGYIAKSLYKAYKDIYDVTSITRKDFDLTDGEATIQWFRDRYYDIVIHCAVTGGSRLRGDTFAVMDKNLCMYYNLLQCQSHYDKFIQFGSGAELLQKDTPYGLSKHVIRQSILEKNKFYNIRIYGVFDENELDTRFIKGNIKRYINKESIVIHQDKFMDFFYMKDLIYLVDYYINSNDLPKQIDCSYDKLYKLSDVANIINSLDDYKMVVKIEQERMDLPYYGMANVLLEFIGLEQGIKEVYNKLK